HQAFDRDLARSIAYDYVDMQLRLIQQIRQEQQNE
ncbi:MAG: transcriptional regulator BetI, partial [Acinetobacter sp.]